MADADYLEQALHAVSSDSQANTATRPLEQLLAPLPQTALAKLAQADQVAAREEAARVAADAAKNRLAQEALLTNPAEMRALWPQAYEAASLNHNGHLDLPEIQKALTNTDLPDDTRNFLTVLKAGYKNFTVSTGDTKTQIMGQLDSDYGGVNPDSLAILNKALDRNIHEDPLYKDALKLTPEAVGIAGLAGALTAFRMRMTGREGALFAGGGAVAGGLLFAGAVTVQKYNGAEDKMYDQVQTNYMSFVKDFDSQK